MNNRLADPRDPLLVERCLHSDEDAWDQLQREYTPLVRAVIHRCLQPSGSPAYLVEELTHEFWGYLWEDNCRRLRAFQPGCPLPPFLGKLAQDFVYAHLRRHRPPEAKRIPLSALQLPDASITDGQLSIMVEEVWAELSPRLRRRLRSLLGLGQAEPPGQSSPRNPWDEDSRLRRKLRALFFPG